MFPEYYRKKEGISAIRTIGKITKVRRKKRTGTKRKKKKEAIKTVNMLKKN